MAQREGCDVVGDYQDEAASAFKGNRGPGLEAALEHVERIKGTLYVQHSDRLARGDGRQARHLVEIALWAMKAGVTIRSVQDPQTFENLLMAVVMGERNTEDSRRKSEATKAGKRRAWERGDFPGGPIPDGFEVIGKKDARTVRLDPDRIKIIRLIGEFADQGWGDASIARELNRRGHRTKADGAWTRRRIKDVLTNPIYCGGVAWHPGAPDQEINWETSFTGPWAREDFERRYRDPGVSQVARAAVGRPNTNHALAGLAVCGRCMDDGRIEQMQSITSTYRRADGSRRRTYVCPEVQRVTGLCDAPRIDAELVDSHVVSELHRYLGDFEAWRDQLTSGYAPERQRLEREVTKAIEDLAEQERVCGRTDRRIGLAETDDQAKAVMRSAAGHRQELERRRLRLNATQRALDEVPTEAPTDAMLDFYSELRAALKGRLDGANTLSRINDALKDIFESFVLVSPPHDMWAAARHTIITAESYEAQLASRPARYRFNHGEGVLVTPILRTGAFREIIERATELGSLATDDEDLRPPLRPLHAPEGKTPTRSRSGR